MNNNTVALDKSKPVGFLECLFFRLKVATLPYMVPFTSADMVTVRLKIRFIFGIHGDRL